MYCGSEGLVPDDLCFKNGDYSFKVYKQLALSSSWEGTPTGSDLIVTTLSYSDNLESLTV